MESADKSRDDVFSFSSTLPCPQNSLQLPGTGATHTHERRIQAFEMTYLLTSQLSPINATSSFFFLPKTLEKTLEYRYGCQSLARFHLLMKKALSRQNYNQQVFVREYYKYCYMVRLWGSLSVKDKQKSIQWALRNNFLSTRSQRRRL